MIRNPRLLKDIYSSSSEALRELERSEAISSQFDASQMLAKAYLLSCASYYEQTVTQLVGEGVQSSMLLPSVQRWLHKCAVDGQFFRWFDFRNARNTNHFLAHFGDEFRINVRRLLDARRRRSEGEQSFIVICVKRNECVHRNFAAYSLDMTLRDIHDAHRRAMNYIRALDYSVHKWLVAEKD